MDVSASCSISGSPRQVGLPATGEPNSRLKRPGRLRSEEAAVEVNLSVVGTGFAMGTRSGAIAPEGARSLATPGGTAASYERIHFQIEQQTLMLLEAYAGTGAAAMDDLADYLKEHPGDLEKAANGQVPEYFGVEATGQRILDIWLPGYDGQSDRAAWVKEAKGYIQQAYDEVASMFGGLPQLVLDTREYVMERLDEFAREESEAVVERLV